MKAQRQVVERLRVDMVQPLLDAPCDGKPPFICLSFFEHRTGDERLVPALFVGPVPRPPFVSDFVKVIAVLFRAFFFCLESCLRLCFMEVHDLIGLSGSCQAKKAGLKNLMGT